ASCVKSSSCPPQQRVVLTGFFFFLDKYLENVLESQHARSRQIVGGHLVRRRYILQSLSRLPSIPAEFWKDGERLRERYQGQSLNRLEDVRFLTGRGKYVGNEHVPGVLHAHVVRSPHASARIVRIDLDAARVVPGVAAVWSEAELAADGIGELPCVTVIDAVEPIIVPPRPALARGVVRHVGDPVVCIIAESPEAALAATEAVDIAYAPLPCVIVATAALRPDAPRIWPESPGNSAFLFRKGDAAAVASAMARAAHIVECDL